MEELLKECLPQSSGINLNQIDWFTSIFMDHFIYDQFEPGTNSTTSDFNVALNKLTISAGSCNTVLQAATNYPLHHIVSIDAIEVVGTVNTNQSYNQFLLHATFDNGNVGVITGQTCLNLKQCMDCDTNGVNIIALDTIRLERLQNGKFFIDQTLEKYELYTTAIDSFNLANNLTVLDTNYIDIKAVSYTHLRAHET